MSALHWEALRKQKVVDKRVEKEQKREDEIKQLTERNRKELIEEYNKGRSFGACANMTSYENQLMASQSRKKSSHGDGVCVQGINHNSTDSDKRRLHMQESVKTIPMPIRYNDTNFAQQW